MTELARDAAINTSELWHELFERAPIPYALVAPDGTIMRGNAAHRALFGYDGTGPVVNMVTVTHPEDDAVLSAEVGRLLSGERDAYEGEHRFYTSDRREFWGRCHMSPLRDSEGEVVGLLGAVADITEVVESRQRLEESESRFRSLVQNAADAIVVVDADANLMYSSPAAEVLAGLEPGSFLGRNVIDLVADEDRDAVAELFLTAAHTPGVGIPTRFRLRRTDGTTVLIDSQSTNLVDDPAVRGVVITLRQDLERSEARSAQEINEHRYRRMLANISDTVTLLDAGGRVIDTTGTVKSVLDYQADFWNHLDGFTLVHPDDLEKVSAAFVEVLSAPGASVHSEFRVRDVHGGYAYIEGQGVNLLHDPEVRAIVLTTRDVTARKHAEQELAAARDAAVRSLELRTEFVASVSHELRTPIHGVLGLAELLASTDLDSESASLVHSIRRAAETLRGVLDDVLDFAKIESGRLELDLRPLSITELVDDMVNLFVTQTAAKGLRLTGVVSDDLPVRIVADSLRIRQVLTNLVGNAVKFTSTGGVELSVSRQRIQGDDMLAMAVTDSGVGISPDALQRIFEPFSQAHAATAREFGGTGLGLTISRRLLELMGGSLEVRSESGRGTTFTARVPLVPVLGPAVDPALGPGVGHAGQGRVLVVEDNPVNQLLVSRQLDRLGYESHVVAGGLAALDVAARERFDVVLMDWRMPDLDGLATTERLRAEEIARTAPRVPVIGMTASVLSGDRERCLAAGMDDVLAKPVNLALLGRTLATWIPARRAAAPDAGERRTNGPPAIDPAYVDRSVIQRLVDELDDPTIVATVVATYLGELDSRVEGLEDAARTGDRDSLRLLSHTLASTSAAVGALSLGELCRSIERDAVAESSSPDRLEPTLAEVRRLARAVRRELATVRAELER